MARFLAPKKPATEMLQVGQHSVPLLIVRNPRARRYLLRLRSDGTARVTIPRGGSAADAQAFVERSRPWLERQWHALQSRPRHPATLQVGSTILFRGEPVSVQLGEQPGTIRFGAENLRVTDTNANLRPAIEKHLRRLATSELALRVAGLSGQHSFAVGRVSVRNQRSRWGSCSRNRTISLNWRLIQTPPHVRDYIILHELAHLRHMNHSSRFWAEVKRLCPNYELAERWLKDHRSLLREA